MQPDETSQEGAAPDPVVEAPQAADVTPEAPSAVEPESRSIREIAAELESAATQAAETPEVETPSAEAEATPPPAKPERQARARFTLQGALEHVRTLRSQGRDAEIAPEALGMVRAYDADVIARHTTEQEVAKGQRTAYLEQLALEATNPADALQRIRSQPKLAEFMDLYGKQHPEVTLDSPDAAPLTRVDPAVLRQQVDGEYRVAFSEFAASLAEEFDIPVERMTEIGAKGQGPFGVLNDLLQSAVDIRVEQAIAKELPKRVADEAKAIRLEEQARYTGKTIITPRYVPGGVPAVDGKQRDPAQPLTMREAEQIATRALETAR